MSRQSSIQHGEVRRDEVRQTQIVLQHFAEKAASSFYGAEDFKRPLGTIAAFKKFASASPKSAEIWLDRLQRLTREDVALLIGRVPESRMSSVTREFTKQLIVVNQTRLIGG